MTERERRGLYRRGTGQDGRGAERMADDAKRAITPMAGSRVRGARAVSRIRRVADGNVSAEVETGRERGLGDETRPERELPEQHERRHEQGQRSAARGRSGPTAHDGTA